MVAVSLASEDEGGDTTCPGVAHMLVAKPEPQRHSPSSLPLTCMRPLDREVTELCFLCISSPRGTLASPHQGLLPSVGLLFLQAAATWDHSP